MHQQLDLARSGFEMTKMSESLIGYYPGWSSCWDIS